jgi:hypothetical protein
MINIKKKDLKTKFFEMAIWLILSFVVSAKPIVLTFIWGKSYIFIENLNLIITSIIIIVLPIVFYLIYRKFPFLYLFEIIKNSATNNVYNIKTSDNNTIEKDHTGNLKIYDSSNEKAVFTYLQNSIYYSKKLSEDILSRSKSYLFIGLLIAIIGVMLSFYIFNIKTLEKNKLDVFKLILNCLRVSPVIFIELVAFFILKQYRISMDEFRYFESIVREKESSLILIKLINEIGKEDFELIVEHLHLYPQSHILKDGDASELLEFRKLTNADFDIKTTLEKLIEKIPSQK